MTKATEATIIQVARICHETNRAYCETLGDNSQVPWDNAPAEIQASVIDGVKFQLANPYSAPWTSHENWYEYKQKDGWKYGPVKDMAKKEHPCMVPFWKLPRDQQMKDWLFTNVVKAFIASGALA